MKANNLNRLFTSVIVLCLFGVPGIGTLHAKSDYPTKPIRLVVGFSAGGGTDSLARAISSFIHEEIGMPGVVINKPGAASMIALKFLIAECQPTCRIFLN